jgi:glycine/D-amino acid oxidase-like deaminating enzyme/nitrite reductase/ring-hydroxylating ferredoxin subunit
MTKKTSPWLDRTPDERRHPQLEKDLDVDVAVIGGGIVGTMAAWTLAKKGLRVALLERNRIGTGDTGYTTAFLTRVPDTSLAALAERYGAGLVRSVCEATASAQRAVFELIAGEKIDCGFKECDCHFYAYTADDPHLKAEWDLTKDADRHAEWLDGEAAKAAAPGAAASIRRAGEARFDVRRFLPGLLATTTGRKIAVHEETPVETISVGRGVELSTPRGTVRAKKLIVATGLPHPAFKELHPLLTPKITYALTLRYRQAAPFGDHIFWDTDEPYQYFRRLDDRTAVLGGCDRLVGTPAPSRPPHETLRAFAAARWGAAEETVHEWSGSIFFTEDGLPYASEHPSYRGKVFIATGFGGNGMVMGAMAGMMTAELAAGGSPAHAELFSFARTGADKKIPSTKHQITNKSEAPKPNPKLATVRWFLPLLALVIAFLPGYVFFGMRGGTGFLRNLDFKTLNTLLFPLVGLYAFLLVWFQFILGSNMRWLRKLFPGVETWHRTQGVFALLFAVVHPTMLIGGYGLESYLRDTFVDPSLVLYVWIGRIQLLLMFVTVGTALLMKLPWLKRRWHLIHYLNYAVFALVWTHSWSLGSDVRPTPLRWLWFFFAATAAASIVARIVSSRRTSEAGDRKQEASASGRWLRVAKASDITKGAPFCASVEGREFAVFRIGDACFAMDNACSHAGGSLCQGTIEGETIECPLHASRFNIKTGSVESPPAASPQTTYETRIRDGRVEIKI